MTSQGPNAPGGKFGYIINGNIIAGYALVAHPDKWGNSGVMTFIVNNQGRVYERNLGENTSKIVGSMTEYNPDPSWKLVEGQSVRAGKDGASSCERSWCTGIFAPDSRDLGNLPFAADLPEADQARGERPGREMTEGRAIGSPVATVRQRFPAQERNHQSTAGLEEFYRISRRIIQQYFRPARSCGNIISEVQVSAAQPGNFRREISDIDYDSVPAPRFGPAPI